MLQYLADVELSPVARGQLETFIDALCQELALPKRPHTASAADGIKAQDAKTRRQIAAALMELAARVPHDSFETGSENFVAELRRYARLVDTEQSSLSNEYFYFSRIRRSPLDAPARELLARYFDARLIQDGVEEAENRLHAAEPEIRAQATLALLELMQAQMAELHAGNEQVAAFNKRMMQRVTETVDARVSDASARSAEDEDVLWRQTLSLADQTRREHYSTLKLLRKLFSKSLKFEKHQSLLLTELIPYAEADPFNYPLCGVAKVVAGHVEQYGLEDEMRPRLESLCAALLRIRDNNTRRWASRLHELAMPAGDEEVALVLDQGDAWAKQARDELLKAPAERRATWAKLLEHARGAVRNKPSKAWLKTAAPLIARLGAEPYASTVCRWFANLGNRKPTDNNSDIMRGLLHASLLLDARQAAEAKALETLAPAIADLAEAGCRRSTTGALVSSKLTTACLETLAAFPHVDAAAQLGRLKQRLKADWIRDKVAQAFAEAVQLHGLQAEDVEESLTPTCGFTEVGRRLAEFDGYQAELSIESGHSVRLRWTTPDGKQQKTDPASVKQNFAAELKALKQWGADALKLIASHRDRLDRLFIERKTWRFDVWRQRYLEHPLVGALARRLIWNFKSGKKAIAGLWLDGELADVKGKPIQPSEQAEVALWHPLGSAAEEVDGWRARLGMLGVTQPFKQAHREVYLLTDAERETNTHSNRFAGHVLRQHQFNALREARGWTYPLMGHWDPGDCVPRLSLPHENMSAEFWVQQTADEETSPAGVLLYICSDQVRFYRDGELLSLADVPPLVFSEVMRDVDLFVGVASIGNDPNWGPAASESEIERPGAREAERQFADYWQSFSFGELSESAKTRASVLREIVPCLNIADRCTFEERFLVVRGKLRTYRIHLGSGNILMEPGSQYLCIVRSHDALAPKVLLPFEGDATLSLILSKAILLSADDKITDSSIRRQIERPA